MRFKFLLILFLFIIFTSKAFASQDFDISSKDTYKILNSGDTEVKQEVTITNKTQFMYTPTYTVNVPYPEISDIVATSSAGILEIETEKVKGVNKIVVLFPKKVVGKGSKNKFTLTYKTSDVVEKKENGWEVVIPGFSGIDEFKSYSVSVAIPPTFGHASIITPTKKTKVNNTYTFQKEDFARSGIYMLFKDVNTPDPNIIISSKFPNNVIFGLPINGAVLLQNTSDEIIEEKTLTIESDATQKIQTYSVSEIQPYQTLEVPVTLGSTPFLTMGTFKVKISFDNKVTGQDIHVGFLPDLFLIFLGGVIIVGSIFVALVAFKTWRIYFQKRK